MLFDSFLISVRRRRRRRRRARANMIMVSAAVRLALCALCVVTSVTSSSLLPRQADVSLLQALRSNNLNGLADALSNYPSVLRTVIASPGKKTLLAPVDAAIANTSNVLIDIPNTLSYHFLNGTLPSGPLSSLPAHTVLHSFTTTSQYANLPGGNGQAIALSSPGQVNEAIDESNFATSIAPFTVGDFNVQPIDHALNIPGTATYTLSFVARRDFSATATGFIPFSIDDMRGATLFVPSNKAVQAFQAANRDLSHDEVAAVIYNHIVQSRVVYSPLFAQGSIVTLSGQDLYVTQEQAPNGAYVVHSGNVSATITQTDIMHRGGVIHLIDNVLLNTNNDIVRARRAGDSALKSANSYVYGPVSATNAASSQGTGVPPSPPGTPASEQAKNSTITNTNDASRNGQIALPVSESDGTQPNRSSATSDGVRAQTFSSSALLAAMFLCALMSLS